VRQRRRTLLVWCVAVGRRCTYFSAISIKHHLTAAAAATASHPHHITPAVARWIWGLPSYWTQSRNCFTIRFVHWCSLVRRSALALKDLALQVVLRFCSFSVRNNQILLRAVRFDGHLPVLAAFHCITFLGCIKCMRLLPISVVSVCQSVCHAAQLGFTVRASFREAFAKSLWFLVYN